MWYERLQRFLYGRYGTDKLNLALLIFGLILSLIGTLVFWPVTLLADALYIWALFRTFSRNIPARQREYAAFLRFWSPIESWLRARKVRFSQRKQYKYFKCPNCRQELRAPRGRGKIEVTCQKCHNVFRTKT
jgi:hypothetical protein